MNGVDLGTYAGIMTLAMAATALISNMFSIERRWLPGVTLVATAALGALAKFGGFYANVDWVTHGLQLMAVGLAANGTYNAVVKPAASKVIGKGAGAGILFLTALTGLTVLTSGCGLHSRAIMEYSEKQTIGDDGEVAAIEYSIRTVASGTEIEKALQSMEWKYGKDNYLAVGNRGNGLNSTAVVGFWDNFAAGFVELGKEYAPIVGDYVKASNERAMREAELDAEIKRALLVKKEGGV